MLSDSFLSIVVHPDPLLRSKMLSVRARVPGDIEAVFPHAEVLYSPTKDYAYRAYLPRKHVERAIARQVRAINYTNFKNSVPDDERHDAYLAVWTTMLRWAQGAFAPKPVRRAQKTLRLAPISDWALPADDDPLDFLPPGSLYDYGSR